MTPYKKLFEAKVDTGIDTDDYIEKVEEKNPEFVSLSLSDGEREDFVKKHSSKKYNWKFDIHSTEDDNEIEKSNNKIRALEKQGWKVFMDDQNVDQRALVFYRKK
jgi:hypothetical protein